MGWKSEVGDGSGVGGGAEGKGNVVLSEGSGSGRGALEVGRLCVVWSAMGVLLWRQQSLK